ncbi:MAG TPA: ATP-dependent helicase, partial [Steroidobacteraceae bacterium]|nr:ATP-dependent helicase [Steroidobacteraceae bacterium]
ILDAANAVIALAPARYPKELFSTRRSSERPELVTTADEQAEADYVADRVLEHREAGIALQRQAVLMRAAHHSDLLEVELARRNIPFVKYGGLRFLEAAHVKDLLSVLRWVDNPRNTLAAFRVLQLLPGMGPVNASAAIEHMEAAGYAFESLRSFKPPQTHEMDWKRLIELMLTLSDPELQWAGQVHQARTWYQRHFERIYEHFHTRLGDLDQLEHLSGQYPSRERFITELTLDPPHATSDLAGQPALEEDYLVLSTIHSAKGMEWDTVYVLNVVDGSFPSEFATGKVELIEEERRLLYVALTRAQNDLALVMPLKFYLTQQPRQGDAHVYGGRSRFMTEKVLKTLDAVTFHGSLGAGGDALQSTGEQVTVDVGARLREMW